MKVFLSVLLMLLFVPALAMADLPVAVEASDSTYASNNVVDFLSHNAGVWLATGKGLNVTYDDGQTWLLYGGGNGLVSDNVSAFFSTRGRLWAATSHVEYITDQNFSISDGLSYSDDNGDTWTQVNFGPDGLDIPYVWGGDQTIFDITGHYDTDRDVDWMFFTVFAGGLLSSQDGGTNWRRIYPSPADSVQFNDISQQPSYRNRYFSCVADTTHGDSLFLWAGTAGGVFQYIFATERDKLFTNDVFDIAFCDGCDDSASGHVYLGGESGVSRGQRSGGPFITRFAEDGLPADSRVTALYGFGSRLFVGTADTLSEASTGLSVSDDYGLSYTGVGLAEAEGADNLITEFTVMDDRLYLSAGQAGLFVSADTGQIWQRILIDSLAPAAAYNAVNSVHAYLDTLFVGTDSGLVALTLDGTGAITSMYHKTFPEDDISSNRIIRVRVQEFVDDTLGTVDSTSIWTVNRPASFDGTPMSARSSVEADTLVWGYMVFDTLTFDISFLGDTAMLAGEMGILLSLGGERPQTRLRVVDSVDASRTFDNEDIRLVKVRGDSLFVGSSEGLAVGVATDSTLRFRVFAGNTDSLRADAVVNYTYGNTINLDSAYVILGITGDFIPALGIQYREDGPARMWASGRPVGSGLDGISVGRYVPVTDTAGDTTSWRMNWRALYGGGYAWNFAFSGDSTFAATDAGLLMSVGDTSEVWDTLQVVDSEGVALLFPGVATYGVKVIDRNLWAGTDEGTVRLNLDDENDAELFVVVDSTTPPDEVYAFPVPFSPLRGGEVQFHFVVEQDANVTIEIYDFAMNLIARPIDAEFYPAGVYPNGDWVRRTWDGMNGKGERVAVGVYYFKVEYSTGETRWGKLAVIP